MLLGGKVNDHDYAYETQLQMVWPAELLDAPPLAQLPIGYTLRTFEWGDQPRFYAVMASVGWPEWDDERLQPWLERILPNGWFMAIHEQSDRIVATAMCLHSYSALHPFGGELGWLAGDPAHAGRSLGSVVSAAVTRRFLGAGYTDIHLYTEDFRFAALRTYLKLGYVPFLYLPEMAARWRAVCHQVHWPFTPDQWPAVQ